MASADGSRDGKRREGKEKRNNSAGNVAGQFYRLSKLLKVTAPAYRNK